VKGSLKSTKKPGKICNLTSTLKNSTEIDSLAEAKILAPAPLADRLSTLRAQNQRIVFTNGCFDLLHIGHARYLAAARRRGDLLVVALNTDESVSGIKPGRPIIPLAERQELMASFFFVDFVTQFSEPTPLNLIQLFRPHVLAKGADWALENIVGAKEVQAWGGEVARIELVEGKGTTQIINKILHSHGLAHQSKII